MIIAFFIGEINTSHLWSRDLRIHIISWGRLYDAIGKSELIGDRVTHRPISSSCLSHFIILHLCLYFVYKYVILLKEGAYSLGYCRLWFQIIVELKSISWFPEQPSISHITWLSSSIDQYFFSFILTIENSLHETKKSYLIVYMYLNEFETISSNINKDFYSQIDSVHLTKPSPHTNTFRPSRITYLSYPEIIRKIPDLLD